MATSPLAQPDIRSAMIARLLQQGTDTSPVQHWTQGAARVAQALLGGYQMGEHEREGREAPQEMMRIYQQQGQQPPQHPLGPVTSGPRPDSAPPAQQPNFGNAIASIESGGRYDAMGPTTRTGDRAHGKYQVMGANIGPWSQAALGRQVTPEEFIADPQLQDQIFQHRFGQYVQKYGPEGAARAWFAGEGGMNDMGRKDQLGTTVGSYGQRFAQAAGLPQGGAPQAQMPPGVAPQMPQPPQQGMAPQQPQGIPPQIQAMVNSPNRLVRDNGVKLFQAWQQQQMQGPKFHKLNDEMLFDERTGRTQQAGPGFRPLTDPNERARFGIPAEDKRPYQIGPGNKLINPPPENRISIDQRAENAFTQKAGGLNAERYNKLVEGGFEAQTMVSDLGALRDIGSRITTGKTAEVKAALGPYAEAVGVKIDQLDDLQAYQAIVSRMAPRMRVAGSGATSDFEMRQFLQALPQLGTTPQGNEIVTNTLESLQQHRLAAADIGSRALAGEIAPRDAEKMIRELPNPLELWKKSRGKSPSASPSQPAAQPSMQEAVDELRRRGLVK